MIFACIALFAFLGEVEKAGLWAVVRLGPWDHGECREGGLCPCIRTETPPQINRDE